MKTDIKRQNFNVTPEQEAEMLWLKDAIDAPSVKDAILYAVRTMATLARETREGRAIYLADDTGAKERLLIPELESASKEKWTYLVERPHAWRRQRFVKGRRLLASTVWTDMLANNMSIEQAAANWELPLEAINEIVRYCEANRYLLQMEADEELRRIEAKETAA
ncbi:MAG: hypothetical protein Q7N50_07590 [Armatimonadota bacterium]|nr:hypothetical protein [Armatimonadota bacterium]